MVSSIQEAEQIYLQELQRIGVRLETFLQNEWEDQGHRATGRLINSVSAFVRDMVNETLIELSYLSYGDIVNAGVKPSRVPFNPRRRSGARTSKFIEALAAWVRLKRITTGMDKDILRTAFAIATNMKKEGIPTKGAFRFSANGRRTGAVDYVLETYADDIQDDAADALFNLYCDYRDAIFSDLENRYPYIKLVA